VPKQIHSRYDRFEEHTVSSNSQKAMKDKKLSFAFHCSISLEKLDLFELYHHNIVLSVRE
jgi:hypothetical protein